MRIPIDLIARETASIDTTYTVVGVLVVMLVVLAIAGYFCFEAFTGKRRRRWGITSAVSLALVFVAPLGIAFADTIRGADPADTAAVDQIAADLGISDSIVLRVGDAAVTGDSDDDQQIVAAVGEAFVPVGETGSVVVATVDGDQVQYRIEAIIGE